MLRLKAIARANGSVALEFSLARTAACCRDADMLGRQSHVHAAADRQGRHAVTMPSTAFHRVHI